MEIWKPAELLGRDYEVSNEGRIRWLGQIKAQRLRDGYPHVRVRRQEHPVHRLVGLAFISNPEGKPQINHKDGVKANNRADNLEWATSLENIRHALETGLMQSKKGEGHPMCRLTEEVVRGIFAMAREGSLHREIAEKVGVSRRQVSNILCGKKWGHLGLTLS